jgi:hypothetical protein
VSEFAGRVATEIVRADQATFEQGPESAAMGFQTSDLRTICQKLLLFSGVSGVWLLGGPTDRDGIIYVTVRGFDAEAHANRLAVISEIEHYLADHRASMDEARFIFDYAVLVDDPELGDPHIPVDSA